MTVLLRRAGRARPRTSTFPLATGSCRRAAGTHWTGATCCSPKCGLYTDSHRFDSAGHEQLGQASLGFGFRVYCARVQLCVEPILLQDTQSVARMTHPD